MAAIAILLRACRTDVGRRPEERVFLERREGFGSESIDEFLALSSRADVDVAVRFLERLRKHRGVAFQVRWGFGLDLGALLSY